MKAYQEPRKCFDAACSCNAIVDAHHAQRIDKDTVLVDRATYTGSDIAGRRAIRALCQLAGVDFTHVFAVLVGADSAWFYMFDLNADGKRYSVRAKDGQLVAAWLIKWVPLEAGGVAT